jgi:hypothetical protein
MAVWYASSMEVDEVKIDEAVLALMWLTLHDGCRAWKSFDWDATDRLYRKGLIDDPANKAKSVVLTEEGLRRSEALFRALFTRPPTSGARPEAAARSRAQAADPPLPGVVR